MTDAVGVGRAAEKERFVPGSDDVDAALQRPAGIARAVAPAPSGFLDRVEPGRAAGFHTPVRPNRAQAHFLPLARARPASTVQIMVPSISATTWADPWRGSTRKLCA